MGVDPHRDCEKRLRLLWRERSRTLVPLTLSDQPLRKATNEKASRRATPVDATVSLCSSEPRKVRILLPNEKSVGVWRPTANHA